MPDIKETHPQLWCMDCGELADDYCVTQRHDLIEEQSGLSVIPDLTGTPHAQHEDIRYY